MVLDQSHDYLRMVRLDSGPNDADNSESLEPYVQITSDGYYVVENEGESREQEMEWEYSLIFMF